MSYLETDRLIIRNIEVSDREEMLALHSDPVVQKYTGEPVIESIEIIEKNIRERSQSDYESYGYGRMAVIRKDSNAFVGWAGLKYLPEFDKTDIGYRFKTEHWGNGFATEASVKLLEDGFKNHNLEEIIAIAMPENKASIRVMEKIGLKFDKLAPYEEGSPDAVWYSLSRVEYFRQNFDN